MWTGDVGPSGMGLDGIERNAGTRKARAKHSLGRADIEHRAADLAAATSGAGQLHYEAAHDGVARVWVLVPAIMKHGVSGGVALDRHFTLP
jgi:hypothetical protein